MMNYFFESLERKETSESLWIAPPTNLQAGKCLIAGPLLKHSINDRSEICMNERYFILQDQHLMFKRTNQRLAAAMLCDAHQICQAGRHRGSTRQLRPRQQVLHQNSIQEQIFYSIRQKPARPSQMVYGFDQAYD